MGTILHGPSDKEIEIQVPGHAGTNLGLAESSPHLCTGGKYFVSISWGVRITIARKGTTDYFISAGL